MSQRSVLMDENDVRRALMRISHQIVEKNKGIENVRLAGIRRRGVPLAAQIRKNIAEIENADIASGELDIQFYRDDLTHAAPSPVLHKAELPFEVTDKVIVLVDDVLYTGRTARAAIEAIFALGRPRAIQLAILVDRGHRDLPIRADFVGKNVPTARNERISVMVPEFDGCTAVELCSD